MTNANWLGLLVPLLFGGMWWAERKQPARSYLAMPLWARWGVGFFFLSVAVASVVPLTLASAGLGNWRLMDGSQLGWWGFPIGILLTSLMHYGWHRAEHVSDLLWRLGHQLHHSPTRVDIAGAFYAHPFEVVMKTLIGLAVNAWLLGLAPVVAASVTTSLAVLSLFQHWNIHTPQWLGWIVPRPEMHALHHERDVHARNYGDLPMWDMLFGTFSNPQAFEGQVGFAPERAAQVTNMLLMRDVHRETRVPKGQVCCKGLFGLG